MRFALVLLTSCIPVQTSTTTSSTPPPSVQSAPAAQPAPAAETASSPGAPVEAAPVGAAGTWFVSEASVTSGPQIAIQVSEGTWLDGTGKPVLDAWGRPWNFAMRTNPATLQTIKWGRPIIVGCGGHWYLTATMSIDQAAGTISIGNDQDAKCPPAIPVANARVIVEHRDVR